MYAKSTSPSAKRDVQNFRSAKCNDQIARPSRAKRAMRMCPRSGQIFYFDLSFSIKLQEINLNGCKGYKTELEDQTERSAP